jgi:hypothetical protein
LADDLARAEDRRVKALEDGAEDMRGWSDIAEKAAFAEAMASLQQRVVKLKSSLEAVFPEDDPELLAEYQRAKQQQEIDEIVARALANADVYRLEVWEDGQVTRQIPIEEGPCDPEAIARQFRDEGVVGALRVIRGERGSPQERCVAEYPLS